MNIGILALQGAFAEHQKMLEQCGVAAVQVRKSSELDAVDGLIIPGGESTTIGKLMVEYGLDRAIRHKARQGMPIFGTCAGMILLAGKIAGCEQFSLKLIDIEVERNAFGRQVDSFEVDLDIDIPQGQTFPAIFIRAPYICAAGPNVRILARFDGRIVMARQDNMLVTAFHPELTDDIRVHQYFLQIAAIH